MLQCDELKDDEGPSNTLEQFTENEQVLSMIDTMKSCTTYGFEKDYQQYTEVLTRYQEQPHLLDPHLDELLQRLLTRIRDTTKPEGEMHAAFKYLYVICKVRTYKVLVKFLPHELSDFDFALGLLEAQDPKEFENWETRYMLLLWMSILVLNPFHMSRLDAYTTEGGSNDTTTTTTSVSNHLPEQRKSKMERIFDICKLYCNSNDSCSNIAAYLSAKYFVRSDIKDIYLERFIDWVISHHQADTVDVKFGELAAIAAILKHGKREDLLPYADKLLQWIVACQYKDATNFLKYKSYIKIVQRIGMVYLKPRVAAWRYKRGTRSLASNLTRTTEGDGTPARATGVATCDDDDLGEGEEIVVPDAIEEVIEELLQGLRSGGNEIRWSAAKGIGRVTNRLSKELADEVIGSVMDVLSPHEPHEAWHGACVALAELAKRGLLLPHRLKELVPLLMQALFYDEMKGYMSVGQHIRDAACYMCWAFARAYNPEDFQPFAHQISAGLLTVAVFDREINCRRAASAAFQESVGRLGNFPYGIEISTTTDFYSVGLRHNSYLNVSYFIAQYEEYQQPLIDHLITRKVNHWDTAIRELTAKALHKLTLRAPKYMSDTVLTKLLNETDSVDINTRHGSVLAIGEIVLALSQHDKQQLASASGQGTEPLLSNQMLAEVNELIPKFLVRDLFRGMSGEIMKQCCTDFIRNCSLARIVVTPQCLDGWQQVIDKCLINKAAPIRESATTAFAELCRAYYVRNDDVTANDSDAEVQRRRAANDDIICAYLAGADNDLEEQIRMGYISALGALPRAMIVPHMESILESLVQHSLTPLKAVMAHENRQEGEHILTYKWSEARRDSVKALIKIVQTVGFVGDTTVDADTNMHFGNPKYFNKVFECLLLALDEYTLDNRGDIGAWVREAAMTALFELVTTCPAAMLQPNHVHQTVVGFMQQAVEKIDRTRGLAGRLFCNLVNWEPRIPHISSHDYLREVFSKEKTTTVLWLFAYHTFPLFCSLLTLPEYSKRILLGLSGSIGHLTETLIKHSSAAFFQFLRGHPNDVERICREIVENFIENVLNERVTYPMLSFLDILIGSGTINAVLLDEGNTFAEDIFRLLNMEVKGHKKLYKLTSSINVYCQLIQVPRLSKRILSKMSVFLGLTYVHVRKTTATKLYEALALHGESTDINEESMDEILNLLSETDWGGELVTVRPIRNELCKLMGIKAPVSGGNSSTVGVDGTPTGGVPPPTATAMTTTVVAPDTK